MELFFQYDQLRLESFLKANGNQGISINQVDSFTCLVFPDVGYFNYCFLNEDSEITISSLETVCNYYQQHQISSFKLVLSLSDCEKAKPLLSGLKEKETLVKTFAPKKLSLPDDLPPLDLLLVDGSNIAQFTKLYLQAFEAEGRKVEAIVPNFASLARQKGVDFYMLQSDGNAVGVNVIYHDKNDYFLAGGALLPEFRKQGWHRSSLVKRIRKAFLDPGFESVISWAYQDGDSLANMLKIGMQVDRKYKVLEYAF